MLQATRQSASALPAVVRGGLLLWLALAVSPAHAGDGPAEGIFVTVPSRITSDGFHKVKDTTDRYVERARRAGGQRELRIVYDFNPDNKPAGTADFGPCADLAKFILRLQNVHTVAYVHADTTQHTVLPVLACREIIMSSEARLGDVRRGEKPGDPIDSDVLEAYRNVVKNRRCPAVALKLLDPDMVVVRATRARGNGDWYIDKRRAAEEEKDGVIVTNPEPVVPAGATSTLYTQKDAERLGLATLAKKTREEVAQAYGLGPASLREDPLMGRSPVACVIELRGAVTDGLAETVKRQVGRAIGQQKANLLILKLECGGGDTLVARDLAAWLRDRKDDRGENPIMTVAYIPVSAPDTAVFLALGCSEIVMQKDARFGDFSAVITEKRNGAVVSVDPSQYKARRDSLEELARQQGYPPLVVRGMMDPELEIYHVLDKKTEEQAFVTGEELTADRAKWVNEQLVKAGGPNGKALVLTADEARQWGIARHKVDGLGEEGLKDTYALYGVNSSQVQTASYDWLDELAEFLRRPVTRIFLVMIGVVCLMLELKMPGVGIPGVIAAVCFILFFWSHSQSAGLDLLGVLLFILGLVLIGLEIFVFPGTGVAGLSGTLLVVFSLALVALEKRPQTSEEWMSLLSMMAQFGLALVGAVLLAVLLVSYLPHIPYLNRLILKPKTDPDLSGDDSPSEAVRPETAALLGAIGVAATPLRPAGKVKFGDEYIDVVAEGAYVDTGTRVQVVEIEGNRIVVKEVL
jgi:membrane-bound serine protease (ClpP class)